VKHSEKVTNSTVNRILGKGGEKEKKGGREHVSVHTVNVLGKGKKKGREKTKIGQRGVVKLRLSV